MVQAERLRVTQDHQAGAVQQLALIVLWDLDEAGEHPVVLQGGPPQLQVGLSVEDVWSQRHPAGVQRRDVCGARGVVSQDQFLVTAAGWNGPMMRKIK